jgi:hypothetical protein
MKIDGPQWDGKEEPRLLEVISAPVVRPQRKAEALTDYAWMDNDGEVKLYLEYPNAGEVDETQITLVIREREL